MEVLFCVLPNFQDQMILPKDIKIIIDTRNDSLYQRVTEGAKFVIRIWLAL